MNELAVRGLLVDVDGTLLEGDQAIPGAGAMLDRLDGRGFDLRLLTNTTRRSSTRIADVLGGAGIAVEERRILTPAALARRSILDSGLLRAELLVPDEALDDFQGLQAPGERPDWIVVGDLGPAWTWERMNDAFRALKNGARLLALQRNPYWHAGEAGLQLDAGAIVAALEFAAEVSAENVGKPSSRFYELALADLGLRADEVLMIGDDLLNDGRGAAAVGCRTALVRTGKFEAAALEQASFKPDLVIDSIADLDLWPASS